MFIFLKGAVVNVLSFLLEFHVGRSRSETPVDFWSSRNPFFLSPLRRLVTAENTQVELTPNIVSEPIFSGDKAVQAGPFALLVPRSLFH